VTRAAERLALTQPAVSGMLTRLRESFDDPLFVRTQRGIAPRCARWHWQGRSRNCCAMPKRCCAPGL
jgi:hypothetical protein